MAFITDKSYAQQLDKADLLSSFRSEFYMEDPNLVYLDGNSLGRLPLSTKNHLEETIVREWGDHLIRSWNERWFELPVYLGSRLSAIIGADPDEVIFSDSTSVNLFKLAYGALSINKERDKIVSDRLNFPSDLYIFQSLRDLLGNRHKIILANSKDGITIPYKELEKLIDERTALVSLSHVSFRSAFKYDMKKISYLAHKYGAMVLWDLSHSVGAVPINLHEAEVDLAVGCSYKYLNGGPGSPAFLYVRKDLQESFPLPLYGWFGEQNPFEFRLDYRASHDMRKFLTGSPPVLSMTSIVNGLELILGAGIEPLRKKSVQQTKYLIFLAKEWLFPLGYSLGSPEDPEMRGSHVSLQHKEAYRICKALTDPDGSGPLVIPDFREPDNIRLGIAPLYTSYEDIYMAMSKLKSIVQDRLFLNYSNERQGVT